MTKNIDHIIQETRTILKEHIKHLAQKTPGIILARIPTKNMILIHTNNLGVQDQTTVHLKKTGVDILNKQKTHTKIFGNIMKKPFGKIMKR